MTKYLCKNLITGKEFEATDLCLELINKPEMKQKIEVISEILPKQKTYGKKITNLEIKKEQIGTDEVASESTGTDEIASESTGTDEIKSDTGNTGGLNAGTVAPVAKPIKKVRIPAKKTKTSKRRK